MKTKRYMVGGEVEGMSQTHDDGNNDDNRRRILENHANLPKHLNILVLPFGAERNCGSSGISVDNVTFLLYYLHN